MTTFCKKFIIFSCFLIMSFCINIHDANAAYCNSQKKKATAGFYCKALTTHACPEGCYCTGGGNFTWAVGDVEKGCKEKWNKITTELNSKGVYLCPSGQTSKAGAKSKSDCFAAMTAEEKRCAPGCFCVNDGKMPKRFDTKNICGYSAAHREFCDDDGKGIAFGREETNGIYTGLIACSRNSMQNAKYYIDEFFELYSGITGLYGFINNKLITMPTNYKSYYDYGNAGVYTCPSAYPASNEGAKSLNECYKYDKNGNKVYYSEKRISKSSKSSKSYDLSAIESIQEKLQNLSDKTTQIGQGIYDVQTIKTLTDDLQNLLNQVNKIVSEI